MGIQGSRPSYGGCTTHPSPAAANHHTPPQNMHKDNNINKFGKDDEDVFFASYY